MDRLESRNDNIEDLIDDDLEEDFDPNFLIDDIINVNDPLNRERIEKLYKRKKEKMDRQRRREQKQRRKDRFRSKNRNNNNNKVPIIVGIDMLGSKSDSAYHSGIGDMMYYQHLAPLMNTVVKIGTNMDEIESIQSIERNNEETYWLEIFYNQENINFFKWIQGWLLIILSIFQIRMIRNWFNSKGYKETPNKNNKKWLFNTVKQGISNIGFINKKDSIQINKNKNSNKNDIQTNDSSNRGKYRI